MKLWPREYMRNGVIYYSRGLDEAWLPFISNMIGDASDYPHWDGRIPEIRSASTRRPEAHVGAEAQNPGGERRSLLWSLALCRWVHAIGLPLGWRHSSLCSSNRAARVFQVSRQ